MAKHHYKRHHRHHRRSNPFGLSKGVLVDAGYNAAGAIGALWLASLIPSVSSGWMGVAATGAAAVAASFAGKFVGGARASEELLKGGLTATIIKALHQAGVTSIGLGLYAPSQFYVPTSSSAYMRTYPGNRNAPQPVMLPAAGSAAAGVHGMGFHRFRSRYAGNY